MRTPSYKDITNNRYGRLVVVKYTHTEQKRPYWECRCDCGNVAVVRGKELKNGGVKSCGCLRKDIRCRIRNDLVGKIFSYLTVVSREENRKNKVRYKCECDCGNSCVVDYTKLVSGHTKSCGCLHREVASATSRNRNQKMVGENHPRWRFDLTDEERRDRLEKRSANTPRLMKWRNKVFARDGYTCRRCGDSQGHNLRAHHIYSWNSHKKMRYLVSNGMCLCEKCHGNFHKMYGYGNNNKKQLNSWLRSNMNPV